MGRPRQICARRVLALLTLALAAACQGPPEVRWHEPDAYPERLSDWGLLAHRQDGVVLGRGVVPYEIATPLFSDHALKLRTVYLPEGGRMRYSAQDAFELPVGSIVTKTFFYPIGADAGGKAMAVAAAGWSGDPADLTPSAYRLVETRLLVRQADGWHALPYVWDGDDAYLRLTGALLPMTLAIGGQPTALPYVVPARSECAGCHATDHASGRLSLIGLKARHVNRPYPGHADSQLAAWAQRGLLAGLPDAAAWPAAADWQSPDATPEQRARAYLDVNCGHCHSPTGPAATSGMHLDIHTTGSRPLGICKPPIAAGRGSGGHRYGIEPGQPDASILVFRMETNDPATRMPETGRSVVHQAGVELVRDWIAQLPGECV